jgi:hypothetical protein
MYCFPAPFFLWVFQVFVCVDFVVWRRTKSYTLGLGGVQRTVWRSSSNSSMGVSFLPLLVRLLD